MSTEYTKSFTVITDKKPRFLRVFVQHEIISKFNTTAQKYEDHNIMTTLHPLRVLMHFNNFPLIVKQAYDS